MIVHRGIPRQRGRGGGYVGRWMRPYHQTGRGFMDIAKVAMKRIGPQALKSAFHVGLDLMHGKPIKDSLMTRGKQFAYEVAKTAPYVMRDARAPKRQTHQKNMRQAVVDGMRRKKRRRVPPPAASSAASRRTHKSRVKRSRPHLQRGRGRRRSAALKRILGKRLRKASRINRKKVKRIIKRTIDIFD